MHSRKHIRWNQSKRQPRGTISNKSLFLWMNQYSGNSFENFTMYYGIEGIASNTKRWMWKCGLLARITNNAWLLGRVSVLRLRYSGAIHMKYVRFGKQGLVDWVVEQCQMTNDALFPTSNCVTDSRIQGHFLLARFFLSYPSVCPFCTHTGSKGLNNK